jgi:GxxExxY protein
MLDTEVTGVVIGAAIEVHRELGPGLLEAVYHACMVRELRDRGVSFVAQHRLPVIYKGDPLDLIYRVDLLVEDHVVVEIKAVHSLDGVHVAQLLTYMKLARRPVGLLLNFNVSVLKDGIRRLILSSAAA